MTTLYILCTGVSVIILFIYKSPVGSRNYKSYIDKTLQKAVDVVLQHALSQIKVAKKYSIPIATLKNKLKGPTIINPQRPIFYKTNVFSAGNYKILFS